jgi:hypothetical protein
MKRILFLLLFAPSIGVAAPMEIEGRHPPSNEEAFMAFVRLLKPQPANDIVVEPIAANAGDSGSHVRLAYSSRDPVPLMYGFLDADRSDMLEAVLPPSDEGEVLLSLTPSPAWFPSKSGIVFIVAHRQNDPMPVKRVRVENHLTFPQVLGAFFRHPFVPERFTYSSMSELTGYRIGNVSVTLLLGLLMVSGAGFLLVIRRKMLCFSLCLVFLLIYEARFLLDAIPHAFAIQYHWRTERRFAHMGDAYAIAESILEQVPERKRSRTSVLVCNELLETPFRYLLYPMLIVKPHELPVPISYAIVDRVWDSSEHEVSCGKYIFPAQVLRLFPDGQAVVVPAPS